MNRKHAPAIQVLNRRRLGFTLFELILAVALSVTLVALISTAINLYLSRVDASRANVEEAQLARSILAMIADDIRAATIYQPQDLSALAAMAASGEFDVDDIDAERGGGSSESGSGNSSGGQPSGGSSAGSGAGTSTGGGTGNMSGGGAGGMSGGGGSVQPESTMPLGLNGSIQELYVDATHLPRQEELFKTVTGYTNAPIGVAAGGLAASSTVAAASGVARPSDLKSVRYFIRPGAAVAGDSVAATSLDPTLQLQAGGLVRQEISRAARVWAEQSGNSAVLDSGQSLLAPEVVHIEFRYFDGSQVADIWNMQERNCLPMAVEIRLWILPVSDEETPTPQYSGANLAMANEYRQTVYLPMSQVASAKTGGGPGSSGSSGTSGASSSGSSSSGSTSGASGSQTGSSLNQL